jgi:hypothetical protein
MKRILYFTFLFLFELSLFSCGKNAEELINRSDTAPLVLTEVGKNLQARGCDENEIIQMMKIETENFEGRIDHVCWWSNHFYYYGHDNGQTHANCGLYAVKRLLFVLGKHKIVNEDLWYRYTDAELRDILVTISKDETDRNQNNIISAYRLVVLMNRLGIPAAYIGVYGPDNNNKWV